MGNAGQDPSKMNIEIWSLGASSESSIFIVGKLRICDLWWPTGLELHVLCLIRRDAAKKPTDSKINCLERTLVMPFFLFVFVVLFSTRLRVENTFLLPIVCVVGSVLRHSHIARTNMRTYSHTHTRHSPPNGRIQLSLKISASLHANGFCPPLSLPVSLFLFFLSLFF